MTTNAVLLPKYIDFFVEHDFSLLISLDGDREADSYRVDFHGKPSFDVVYGNIKEIQAKYPDYFLKNVMFNAVLNGRNGYEQILRFFDSEFGKRPTISSLSLSDLKEEKKPQFQRIRNTSVPSKTCIPLESSPYFSSFMHDFRRHSGNVYYDYNELLYDWEEANFIPTGTCFPFFKKMFVTAQGKIMQCERINHIHSLGLVKEDGVFLDYGE